MTCLHLVDGYDYDITCLPLVDGYDYGIIKMMGSGLHVMGSGLHFCQKWVIAYSDGFGPTMMVSSLQVIILNGFGPTRWNDNTNTIKNVIV